MNYQNYIKKLQPFFLYGRCTQRPIENRNDAKFLILNQQKKRALRATPVHKTKRMPYIYLGRAQSCAPTKDVYLKIHIEP
jgi:hypothetical protein